MSEQSKKYRRHAEEARQTAEKCDRLQDKESRFKIADAWMQLAEDANKF